MSKPFLNLPLPTACLSASLLLLPLTAQAQWACQTGADGAWNCRPQQAAPGSPPRPAPPPAARPESPRKPLAQAVAAPAAAPVAGAATAAPTANDWDWVPNAPAGACCKPNTVCNGAYVQPERSWEDAERAPKGAPVRASADHTNWEGTQVHMDGNVVVTQGNLRLTADRAELDQATSQVRLFGDVAVSEPGMKITGSNADMTTDNSFGDVIDARVLDYSTGMRVTANKLARRKADVIELDEATYTRCPPDSEDWRLDSKRIRLNRSTGRGEAGATVIRVRDTPVFYTPYLNFPIDDRRQTGFLWPSIGSSSSGIDVAIPFYINIAPAYDATLTPRVITDRGSMLETEFRALNRYSEWQLLGTQLNNDQKTGEDRWYAGIRESGQLTSRISTYIDYSKVSDDDYFHDFSIASLSVKRQTSLNQAAAISYNYLDWSAQLLVQQYQTLDELLAEPYRKMPQLTLAKSAGGANFKLDYSLLTEFTVFDYADNDLLVNGNQRVTGNRLYVEPGITFPMRWAPGYITPELRLRHVSYDLNDQISATFPDQRPSVTVPQAVIDAGLYFDRDFSFSNNDYVQTLEPRLFYLYSPYKEQFDQPNFDTSPLTFDYHQLFQSRRFTGHDRLEDFNQMSVGVTTRFIENSSGRELANASLGQIFYFADRKVNTLNSPLPDSQPNSSVAAQFVLQPNDPLWSTFNMLWSPDQNQVEQGNVYVHYEPTERTIYNIGYRYNTTNPEISTLNNGIRQLDASAALPLTDKWRLFVRYNYDLDMHSALEQMFGLEYEDCCWRTRVVYQRAVFGEELNAIGIPETKRQSSVLVEFQLKGLGGLGRKVGTLLEESIWGYRERD